MTAGEPLPDAAQVADLLERVRAGVRQRQSELATLSGGEETKLRLLELETLEYVEEPLAVSPRPVVGRALVFLKKAAFHLFFKWYVRPVRERQNRFNQVASQLLHEQAGNQARLAETLAAALRQLAELERQVEAAARRDPGDPERRGGAPPSAA
ncbi:MAG TPA: hypothetical protein VF121_15325 [Thermoanaerobaculia bacterium]|nr:hypothetical protein [Thermoanaerobaculia bacterium]